MNFENPPTADPDRLSPIRSASSSSQGSPAPAPAPASALPLSDTSTDPHPPRPETTAADSTTTFPSHSYLLPGSDPPSIAPSTSATYIQASTFPWQSASQTPLAAGPATTTAAETLGPNGSGSTPFRPWGTEFVRSLPTDIDFDQLEMLEADYRAMMTYSSRSMLALSQGKSTSEVQMELLKSLARFDADESRSP